MENKIKDVFDFLKKGNDKKIKMLLAIGLIAIVLIFVSDISSKGDKQKESNSVKEYSYSNYTNELEEKLTSIISSIDGVGNCKVMITLNHLEESVYATNYESNINNDSESYQYDYVIYDSDNGEAPIVVMEYLPQIQGVSVVCSGGDDVLVKEKIIDAVTALFNIPSNRVSVSKLNENR